MADGDIVRKVTISATGENIDATTQSVKNLGDATDKTTASASSSNSVWVDAAAGLYLAKSAFDGVATASDSAGAAYKKTIDSLSGGVGTAVSLLPAALGDIWQQGIDKLNSYVELNTKAGLLGTDFYQRIALGAAAANVPMTELLGVIDNVGKSLQTNFNNVLNDPNTSTFAATVKTLSNNGNLQGLQGQVNRVSSSVDPQEQLQEGAKLIQSVLDQGATLAAYKLSDSLFGSQATANLRQNNDYFLQMLASIDKIKAEDLIKQPDIDRAVALTTQLDASKKIIDSWFNKPSSDWSSLGIEIQQLWVNANTNFASVLTTVESIFSTTKAIAGVKPDPEGSIWTIIGNYFNDGTSGVTKLDDLGRAQGVAQQSLASQLGNSQNITRAGVSTQRAGDLAPDYTVANNPLGLASDYPPKPKDDVSKVKGAYELAIDSVNKYTLTTQAATEAEGKGVEVTEQLKSEAQLYAAALKEGKPVTDQMTDAIQDLSDKAGAAALSLAKAKQALNTTFATQTALLSPEDVQIATQLKGIYPDVADALNSVEASAIKANNNLKDVGTFVQSAGNTAVPALRDMLNGTTSLGTGFQKLGLTVVTSLEDMIIKLTFIKPLIASLGSGLSGLGLGNLFGGGGSSGTIDGSIGSYTQFHSGGIVGQGGSPRDVLSSVFIGAPRFHDGLEPDEFPAILQAGERVTSKAGVAAGAAASATVHMNDNRTINIGQGASQQTVQQLQDAFAQDRKQRYADTVKIITDAKARGSLRR